MIGPLQTKAGAVSRSERKCFMSLQEQPETSKKETRRRGRRLASAPAGREVLLAAAMSAFARHGFDGASLRSIAADANVDMALAARLFGSKAKLWQAVVNHLSAKQSEHRQQVLDIADAKDADPAQALRRFIQLFAEISWEMPEFSAFFMQEATNPGERYDIIIRDLVRPFIEICLPIVEAAISSGVTRARDPELFLQMLLAAISTPMVSPAFRNKEGSGDRLRNDLASEAIAMFVVTPRNQ